MEITNQFILIPSSADAASSGVSVHPEESRPGLLIHSV